MFNEILTGKATLEPPPAPRDPYREESVPDVSCTCARCSQTFTAKANKVPLHCGSCNAIIAQENAAVSAMALREAEANFRKSEASHRLLKGLIIAGVAIALAFIRYQMRSQMRDDSARAAGYSSYSEYESERKKVYPTDEYSYEVNSFADEMCRCSDLACARNVRAQYQRYVNSHSTVEDSAIESAEQDGQRLIDCQSKFEQ